MTDILRFTVGRSYAERFLNDFDSIAEFPILARTAKSITTMVHGRRVQRRIYIEDGVEHFKPFGSYSMAMSVGADRPTDAVEG
jgi:hypothetical protein